MSVPGQVIGKADFDRILLKCCWKPLKMPHGTGHFQGVSQDAK